MTGITASMVAQLRGKTDAPLMECKKALTEAAGDMAKAEEILRVKLGSKAGKAASRVTAEGVVVACISDRERERVGALLEVNCETDFVAKNEHFLALCQGAVANVVAHNPADLDALGATLLSLDGFGPTLEDTRKGLIGKIGENVSLRRFVRWHGDCVSYVHNGRIGVLVQYTGSAQAARDVAMHIAAMQPVALTRHDVPAALVERERSVAIAKAAQTDKPPEIVAKMVEGSVQKYLRDVSLLDQLFVKDDKQTVAHMLTAQATQVQRFVVYVVGEGLEKKTDDFAAEVAAQVAAVKGQ